MSESEYDKRNTRAAEMLLFVSQHLDAPFAWVYKTQWPSGASLWFNHIDGAPRGVLQTAIVDPDCRTVHILTPSDMLAAFRAESDDSLYIIEGNTIMLADRDERDSIAVIRMTKMPTEEKCKLIATVMRANRGLD